MNREQVEMSSLISPKKWRELANYQYDMVRWDGDLPGFCQSLLAHALQLCGTDRGWIEQATESSGGTGWVLLGSAGMTEAEIVHLSGQLPPAGEPPHPEHAVVLWKNPALADADPTVPEAIVLLWLRHEEWVLGRIGLIPAAGFLLGDELRDVLDLYARFAVTESTVRLPRRRHTLTSIRPRRPRRFPPTADPCHTMIFNSAAGFYRSTLSGQILECNDACARLLGYESPADLVRFESSALFVAPEERELILKELKNQGGSLLVEGLRRRKDGRTIRLLQDLQLFPEEPEGEPIIHGIFFEITDPRRNLEPLQRDLSRFRRIVESLPDSILLIDAEARILYSGPSSQRIFGYTPQELESHNGFEFIHPEDQRHAHEQLSRLVTETAEITTQLRVRHRNGLWRWAELTGCNRLQDPELHALLLIYRDITDRRVQDEEVWRSAERNRLILEATGDVVWDWDIVTNAIQILTPVPAFFGYPPSEVSASIPWWYQRIHPDDVERMSHALVHAMKHQQPFWSGEFRLLRADGMWAPVLSRGYFIRDAAGTPLRMTGAIMDLSDRQKLLNLLQEGCEHLSVGCLAVTPQGVLLYVNAAAQQLLRPTAADLAGTNILDPATVEAFPFFEGAREALREHRAAHRSDALPTSHHHVDIDFFPTVAGVCIHMVDRSAQEKARLAERLEHQQKAVEGIAEITLGFVQELLRQHPLPPEAAGRAPGPPADGGTSAQIAGLLHQLEVLSGHVTPHPLRVRIHPFLRHKLEQWQGRLPAGIRVEFHADPHLGSIRLDASQLEEVLDVLIENAILAMSQGGSIRLITRRFEPAPGEPSPAANQPCLDLTIADTGSGMDENTLAHIFEPGFSGWAAGKRMGLGLPLAHRIVTQQRGHIEVESEPGKGTEFHICFPLYPPGPNARPSPGG